MNATRSRLSFPGFVLFWPLVLTLCAMVPHNAEAESLGDIFDEANNAFWNGEYETARAHYHRLIELGVKDAAVYYNLGTAEARLGRLGHAALQYERALNLEPGHLEAFENLSVIRKHIARRASEAGRDADLAPSTGPWRAVLDRFSPKGATAGFAVFWVALFCILVARRCISSEMPRLSLGVAAGVFGVLTLLSGAVTAGKWHQQAANREAVVVAQGQLEAVEGPGSSVKRFTLEEAARVEILERRGDWTRVLDAEGRDGWALSEDLGAIR